MKFKKFAAVILMSVMIGSMSLSGCGINKNATAVTMTGDAIDTIEVDMGYANFAARIQQASYDSIFASYMAYLSIIVHFLLYHKALFIVNNYFLFFS